VGSDEVFDAALRRAGAVRVRSFVELFSAAKCLASRYRPVGPRLAIVTNGGGPGVLAADWVQEISLHLGRLSPESVETLRPALPEGASLSDLIDVSEDAAPEHYAGRDPRRRDGSRHRRHPRRAFAEAGHRLARGRARRLRSEAVDGQAAAVVLDGGRSVGARAPAQRSRHPELPHPEAPSARSATSRRSTEPALLQQTPPPLSHLAKPDIEGARLRDRQRARRAPQGADRDGVEDAAVVLPHPGHADAAAHARPTRR
jgi:acetyltransferase